MQYTLPAASSSEARI